MYSISDHSLYFSILLAYVPVGKLVQEMSVRQKDVKLKTNNIQIPAVTPAHAGNDKHLLGYPFEIFVIKLDEKFTCIFCKLIIRKPMQSFCGHRMCELCYQHEATAETICPACMAEESLNENSNLEQVFKDRAIAREMAKLDVICEESPECDWAGKLKAYPSHAAESCTKRRVKCKFGCFDRIAFTYVAEHNRNCVDNHLLWLLNAFKSNENKVQTFRQGRDLSGLNTRLAEIESSLTNIMPSISDFILTQATEQNTFNVEIGNTRPSSFEHLEAIQIAHDCLESKMEDLFNNIEERYKQLANVQNGLNQDQNEIKKLTEQAAQMERSLTLKDTALKEVETRRINMESTSYDGMIIFRISDWSQKLRDATTGVTRSIYSAPFYTSRTGYKMCCRVYPNGDGVGRGKDVGVFFVIMRGLCDATLSWPFRQKVTFTLLDQTNSQHIVESFHPIGTSSSFRRPATVMNIATGCPTFVPLSKLQMPSNYVVDDVMFIKIAVDRSGI